MAEAAQPPHPNQRKPTDMSSRTRPTQQQTRARRNLSVPRASKNTRRDPKGAATTGRVRVPFPRVTEPMWALVYDVEKDKWEKTRGFRKMQVARPEINPRDPLDTNAVIVKLKYTGFCGPD